MITYHSSRMNTGRIINQNSVNILHMNEDVKSVFTPGSMTKTKQLFSQGKTLPFRKNCWLSSV